MSSYTVVWKIELDADSPEEAAQEARKIQLDRGSEALCFEVARSSNLDDVSHVDLLDLDSE